MKGAIVKKSSLAGLAEGWDESCYAYVKPATGEDRRVFRQALTDSQDTDNTEELAKIQDDMVLSHFVSGKVKLLNEDGKFELADMQKEHLEVGLVSDRLAMDIMGFDLDPKEWAAVLKPPSEDSNSTETQSSEDSQETSPTK